MVDKIIINNENENSQDFDFINLDNGNLLVWFNLLLNDNPFYVYIYELNRTTKKYYYNTKFEIKGEKNDNTIKHIFEINSRYIGIYYDNITKVYNAFKFYEKHESEDNYTYLSIGYHSENKDLFKYEGKITSISCSFIDRSIYLLFEEKLVKNDIQYKTKSIEIDIKKQINTKFNNNNINDCKYVGLALNLNLNVVYILATTRNNYLIIELNIHDDDISNIYNYPLSEKHVKFCSFIYNDYTDNIIIGEQQINNSDKHNITSNIIVLDRNFVKILENKIYYDAKNERNYSYPSELKINSMYSYDFCVIHHENTGKKAILLFDNLIIDPKIIIDMIPTKSEKIKKLRKLIKIKTKNKLSTTNITINRNGPTIIFNEYNNFNDMKSNDNLEKSYLFQLIQKLHTYENNFLINNFINNNFYVRYNNDNNGNEGIDAGGLIRDFYTKLSHEFSSLFIEEYNCIKFNLDFIEMFNEKLNLKSYMVYNWLSYILLGLLQYNVNIITPINFGHIIKCMFYIDKTIFNEIECIKSLNSYINIYKIGDITIKKYLQKFLEIFFNKCQNEIIEIFESKQILSSLYLFIDFFNCNDINEFINDIDEKYCHNEIEPNKILEDDPEFYKIDPNFKTKFNKLDYHKHYYSFIDLLSLFDKYNVDEHINNIIHLSNYINIPNNNNADNDNAINNYNNPHENDDLTQLLIKFSCNLIILPEELISKIFFHDFDENLKKNIIHVLRENISILYDYNITSAETHIKDAIIFYREIYKTDQDFFKKLLIFWSGSPHIYNRPYIINYIPNVPGALSSHTCTYTLDFKGPITLDYIDILIYIMNSLEHISITAFG